MQIYHGGVGSREVWLSFGAVMMISAMVRGASLCLGAHERPKHDKGEHSERLCFVDNSREERRAALKAASLCAAWLCEWAWLQFVVRAWSLCGFLCSFLVRGEVV